MIIVGFVTGQGSMKDDERTLLIKTLDRKQDEIVELSDRFKRIVTDFKQVSKEYCREFCPLSVVEKGQRVQKMECDGDVTLNVKPCENHKKQNEFFELCGLLLGFLNKHLEEEEIETGS